MPFFSICIPTYNRLNILEKAIRSILLQTCADFEIVVSDNASEPSAREVVSGFNDPRIRYFRHEKMIYGSEHWEFALKMAKGSYVLLLADDDALVPSALQRVKSLIETRGAEVVQVGHVRYSHPKPQSENSHISGILFDYSFTGQCCEYDTVSFTKSIFSAWGIIFDDIDLVSVPGCHPSGAFMSRKLLTDVIESIGGLTTNPFGDVGFLNVTLRAKKLYYLDFPLTIVGIDVDREFCGPIKGRRRDYDGLKTSFLYSPLKAKTFTNLAVESHLKVANANLEILKPGKYTLGNQIYIRHFFEIIYDVVWDRRTIKDLWEWANVIREKGIFYPVIKETMMKLMVKWIKNPMTNTRRLLQHLTINNATVGVKKSDIHYSNNNRFNDIVVCARHIEKTFRQG